MAQFILRDGGFNVQNSGTTGGPDTAIGPSMHLQTHRCVINNNFLGDKRGSKVLAYKTWGM